MAEIEMRPNQPCAEPEPAPLKKEPEIVVHDDELELSEDDPKTLLERCWYAFSKAGEAAGFDVPDIKTLEVDNTVVDTQDLPKTWTLNSFIFYQCCFWALAAFFFAHNYVLCRTSTFISLDSGAGVCKGEDGSESCCEVPTGITGEFLADSFGRWNTFPRFNYNFNNYMLTLTGASYTNDEYSKLMSKISSQVRAIGSRGKSRDYSWNMVAWSSFTSINTDSGFFKFYMSGDAGIIFSKTIVGIGFASNSSVCNVPIGASVNYATREMEVKVELGCDSPPCKLNPCPGTLSPQAFGYDTESSSSTAMSFSVDLASINTALAVNMGILPIDNLVQYNADNSRTSLLQAMVNEGSISATTMQNTTSYYEPLYAPMSPIYCTKYNNFNTTSCYVRIGNTLLYPVINHFGWSDTGFDRPTRCARAAATVTGSAANFYCNKMDLVTGLIYYPVPTVNITYLIKTSSWTPTRQPSQHPTPLPGFPTIAPTTARPTAVPTTRRPSAIPTRRPSRNPSAEPTLAPTAPTVSPSTIMPTFRRTRKPTSVVTGRRLERVVEPEEVLESEGIHSNAVELQTFGGSDSPTSVPSSPPTSIPSSPPTSIPSSPPTGAAAGTPTSVPTSTIYVVDDYFNPIVYDDQPFVFDDNFPTQFNYGPFYGQTPFDPTPGTFPPPIDYGAEVTYSELVDYSAGTDGFVPLIPQIVDNGKIFEIGKFAAERLSKSLQNDELMARNSYDAMISTVLGSSRTSFRADFRKICNGNGTIAAGCAMFAFEVYGGDNRAVNEYQYQPSSTPAFTDTLFASRTMAIITKRAPTSLVETYYSCVLGIWDSIFQAIGLANSTVQFFVTVGFFIYFYSVVTYLNRVQNKEIELLKAKKRRLAREAKMREKQLNRVAETFSVMKTRFDALCDDMKRGDRNLTGFERAVLLTEQEAVEADLKNEQALDASAVESPSGYNKVTASENDGKV